MLPKAPSSLALNTAKVHVLCVACWHSQAWLLSRPEMSVLCQVSTVTNLPPIPSVTFNKQNAGTHVWYPQLIVPPSSTCVCYHRRHVGAPLRMKSALRIICPFPPLLNDRIISCCQRRLNPCSHWPGSLGTRKLCCGCSGLDIEQ